VQAGYMCVPVCLIDTIGWTKNARKKNFSLRRVAISFSQSPEWNSITIDTILHLLRLFSTF